MALSADTIELSIDTMALSADIIKMSVDTMALSVDTMALSANTIELQVDEKKPDCNLTNLNYELRSLLLAEGEYYELGIALQDAGFNQGLWGVVVGRFAVRTTYPFLFSTKLVYSTMRSSVGS